MKLCHSEPRASPALGSLHTIAHPKQRSVYFGVKIVSSQQTFGGSLKGGDPPSCIHHQEVTSCNAAPAVFASGSEGLTESSVAAQGPGFHELAIVVHLLEVIALLRCTSLSDVPGEAGLLMLRPFTIAQLFVRPHRSLCTCHDGQHEANYSFMCALSLHTLPDDSGQCDVRRECRQNGLTSDLAVCSTWLPAIYGVLGWR